MKLFVDMDGVLVDFDLGYERELGKRPSYDADESLDWKPLLALPYFWLTLPPMPDAFELWAGVLPHSPTILTGVPSVFAGTADQKRTWVARHLGPDIPVITCPSREKYLHGKPGDVLIDDRPKCGLPWVKMGGVWITHTSAEKSLGELAALMGAHT